MTTQINLTNDILERMELIRQEHPDGNYPAPFADHEPGDCIECDALRALDREDDR